MQNNELNTSNEFGQTGGEQFNNSNSPTLPKEINEQCLSENPVTREENAYRPNTKKPKRKPKSFMRMLGLVSALVVSVAVVEVLPKVEPKISIIETAVGGDYFAYNLSVDNPDKVDLTLLIYNDYFKQENSIVEGEIKGVVEGLKADTKYKFEVKGSVGFGGKTFYSSTFKTQPDDTKFSPTISVTHLSKPNQEGLFFTIAIDDFLNYYTNYKVFFEIYGYKEEFKIKGNITDEQHFIPRPMYASIFNNCIFLSTEKPVFAYGDMPQMKYIMTITVDSTNPNDLESGQTFKNITVYQAEVSIEGSIMPQ
ncbi:MAG: hypothetical protein RR248_02735 [Clostridia bacterium]